MKCFWKTTSAVQSIQCRPCATVVFLVVAALLAVAVAAGAAPPANDDFANRIVIQQPPPGGSITISGSLNEATLEAGEINPAAASHFLAPLRPPARSVWWELSMTNCDMPVRIELIDHSFADRGAVLLNYPSINSTVSTSGGVSALQFFGSLIAPLFVFPDCDSNPPRVPYLQLVGGDDGDSHFTLKFTTTNAAPFSVEPVSQAVITNQSVTLLSASYFARLFVDGYGYQWYHNGVAMLGETLQTLAMHHVTTNQAGDYFVVATNWNPLSAIRGQIVLPTVITSRVAHVTVLKQDLRPPLGHPVIGTNGQFTFPLAGVVGRSYRIESSTNLSGWTPLNQFANGWIWLDPTYSSVVVDTNGMETLRIAANLPRTFVRARGYRPANEICNINLKQLRFLNEWIFHRNSKALTDSWNPTPDNLALFFKGTGPVCPKGGIYTLGDFAHPPVCSFPGHVLEEP